MRGHSFVKPAALSWLLLFALSQVASAQTENGKSRWQGYYFLAPAATNGVEVSTGLGGEVFVHKGIGLNIEGGAAGTRPLGNADATFGVASADATYHFFPKTSHPSAEPFVEGGYTLFFNGGPSTSFDSGANLGGGANVWFSRHVALRLEVRGYLNVPTASQLVPARGNFATFRFGVTIR